MIAFPWMLRSTHSELMNRLEAECADLRNERKVLLDRLATIGLGGPLYTYPLDQEQQPVPRETGAELADPDRELLERMMRLRRRPAKLAESLTRQYRNPQKHSSRNGVARVTARNSAVASDLDRAEALGKESGKASAAKEN